MKTSATRAVVIIAATVGLARAGADDPRVGRRVITQFGAVLKVGDTVVEGDRGTFHVYRVEQTNGDWLWLQAEGTGARGWTRSRYVIPFEEAIDYLTGVLDSNPSSFHYNRRGLVWRAKDEYEIAIADYNDAIRLDPRNGAAYVNRGNAWDLKGDHDRAIADYNEALRIDPKSDAAYYNRGMVWARRKERDRAIADYNEAIRINPKHALACYGRGLVRADKGDHDRAIADYDEAVRIDPRLAMAYNGRGNSRPDRDIDRAIADYGEAIRIDPRLAPPYHNRGLAWVNKRDYARAIADYGEAIRIDPKLAPAYNGRAWSWATCPDERYRDGNRAVESATRACELTSWKDAFCLGTLAASHAETGDFAEAVKFQEKAIGLKSKDDPDWGRFQDRLALYKDKKPYREP